MQSGIRGGRVSEAEAHEPAGHWDCCAGRRGKWTLQELCRAMRLAVLSKRASWREDSEGERGAETQGAPWPESTRHFISASRSTRLLTDIDLPRLPALHCTRARLFFVFMSDTMLYKRLHVIQYPRGVGRYLARTTALETRIEDPHQRRYSRQS